MEKKSTENKDAQGVTPQSSDSDQLTGGATETKSTAQQVGLDHEHIDPDSPLVEGSGGSGGGGGGGGAPGGGGRRRTLSPAEKRAATRERNRVAALTPGQKRAETRKRNRENARVAALTPAQKAAETRARKAAAAKGGGRRRRLPGK